MTTDGDGFLRTEGLTCDFGGLRAVDGVSLSVERGTVHSLIGPNAAGKTTLFNLLSGEIPPTAGRVWFDGRDVTALPPHRIPHLGIARCFQRNNLFPKLSVLQNVWVAAFSRRRPGPLGFLRRVGDFDAIGERARAIVTDIGLEAKLPELAETLSHGQQRALEVAIALAGEPTFLLLDEPTQGLAPEATVRMTELIQRLARRFTILLIEHKMHVVMSISDRISVMHFGRIIAEGKPDDIRRNPEVQKAYLGVRR
ncbi:MAG: ABC transporter ATP-binding protein [Candidatus Rokuibacteriota bacterium]